GAALIDERVAPERRRQLRSTRLSHELDVIDVRAAIHPVIGARKRRGPVRRVERFAVACAALETGCELAELRLAFAPSIERSLQCRRDRSGGHAALEIPRDDDEGAVAPARLAARKFHGLFQLST